MFQKPTVKEDAVVEKGNRDSVQQRNRGLQRALNGDREALGDLFASQTPQLYRAALRILGKPQDAEEALQDGFLSAIRHLGEFERRSRFSTWLTRIVINVALMRLRKSRRELLTSFDDSHDRDEIDLAVTVIDPRPNPEEIYQWKERFQMFEQNLRKLPPRDQSILWLRDIQEMSTQEAAELLDMKPTTFKSTRYRARLRLGVGSGLASALRRTLPKAGAIVAQRDVGLSPD